MSMYTAVPETDEEQKEFRQWFYKKKMQLERERRSLEDEKRCLKLQWDKLERERRDYRLERQADEKMKKQQEYVLSTKQSILEEELKKLADEKKYLERQREFYAKVRLFQQGQEPAGRSTQKQVRGALFFAGVQSEIALKKRYKDLIKIYHPDNLCGDTQTLQEINREYDRLRLVFEAC